MAWPTSWDGFSFKRRAWALWGFCLCLWLGGAGCVSPKPFGAVAPAAPGHWHASYSTHTPPKVRKNQAATSENSKRSLNQPGPSGELGRPERYHIVQDGETLWRISQHYGVDVHGLMTHNQISDPTQVAVGTRLKIHRPGISASNAPSGQWQKGHASHSSGASEVKSSPRESGALRRTSPVGKASSAQSSKPSFSSKHKSQPGLVRKKGVPPPAVKGYALRWPVKGKMTSRYGRRYGRVHDGIDIAAPVGTPVFAAAAGEVLFSDRHGSYGHLVVIKHDNGLVTVYAHNSENVAKVGAKIRSGQLIAYVGQTGRATGPHVHFEVRKGTTPQNPIQFLPP